MKLGAILFIIGMSAAQAQDNPNLPSLPSGPPPAPAVEPVPAANPAPVSAPNPAPTPNFTPETSPAAAQPLLTPLPPSLSKPDLKKLDREASERVKSPFMLPKVLYLSLMKKKVSIISEGFIDPSVAPARRWPLKYYQLVAVIWSVKNPKAMIKDKDGVMHLYREKDYIGNLEGFITEINNGEVVVLERGAEVRLKLTK